MKSRCLLAGSLALLFVSCSSPTAPITQGTPTGVQAFQRQTAVTTKTIKNLRDVKLSMPSVYAPMIIEAKYDLQINNRWKFRHVRFRYLPQKQQIESQSFQSLDTAEQEFLGPNRGETEQVVQLLKEILDGRLPTEDPTDSNGTTLNAARQEVQLLLNKKQKRNAFGDPDPSTGLLSPAAANAQIKKFISQQVALSSRIMLADKFALINTLKMGKDAFRRDDIFNGALNAKDRHDLGLAIATANFTIENTSEAQKILAALAKEKQSLNNFRENDPETGFFTPEEANRLIISTLQQKILSNTRIARTDKYKLLEDHQMRKDRFNEYDPRTGALTPEDVQRLIREI